MLREAHPAAQEKCANKSASYTPISCTEPRSMLEQWDHADFGRKQNWDGDCCEMWAPYFMLLRFPLSEQSSRCFVFRLLQNVRAEREVVAFLGLCFLFFEGAVSFVSLAGLSWLCLQIISSCPFPFAGSRDCAVGHQDEEAEIQSFVFPLPYQLRDLSG